MAKIIINKTTLPDGTNGECGYLDADSETLIATEKVFAKGITYTLSFLVKADGGKTIRFCNGYNETELTHTTTTEWTKAIFTFTANDTFVGFIVPTGKYYLYQAQVESGELATNWNPSVNDSDKEIAELNSLILQTSEEIMTNVSATYATKDAFTGLETRVSKAETSITQTAEEIRLEASNTYSTKAGLEDLKKNLADNYSTTVEMNAAIKVSADSITNTVSATYATQSQLNSVSNLASTANQTANSAYNGVSGLATRVTSAESTIKQQADEIELRVKEGDVSSQLSVESDQVTISGNRLVVDADNFQLTAEGSVTCDDMTITGGQIDVIGETAQDTRITVTNSVENPVLSSAIGPGQMFFDFYDKYHTIIGAGMQAGSVGTCALLMDYETMLVGLGHAGINFGYTNSSVLDAYYRRDGALINGNSFTKGSLFVGAKTAWNDANVGWYLGADGTMHGANTAGPSIHFHYAKSGSNTSSIDEPSSGKLRLTPSVMIGNNASAIKLIRCGSSVFTNLTVGSGGNTSIDLFTMATVQGWCSTASFANTTVLASNADASVNSVHVDGAALLGSKWYATFDRTTSSASIRVNWTVIVWA